MSQKMEAASEATAVAIEQNEAEAVKFIYPEKATKICQNLPIDLLLMLASFHQGWQKKNKWKVEKKHNVGRSFFL